MTRSKLILISVLAAIILVGSIYVFSGAHQEFCKSAYAGDSGSFFVHPENDAPDNIVFIVIDTLRADYLPFYGYEKPTAPFLTSLAERSLIFEHAYSSCSSTAPAMASIFTSLIPSAHGVITGKLATAKLDKENQDLKIELNRIPEDLTTIVELAKQRGYRTFGVADNVNICEEMGFTGGFDKFRVYPYSGAPKINKTVLKWEQEIKSQESPYFLYIHYMDPHEPYNKRKPYFLPADNNRQHTINAYESEIHFTDRHIAQLFEHFGWKDNALVIIVSDHGEEFWDHGGFGHGKTLYPEVVRVPLMFYHRNLTARRVTEVVHTIDIMPTLAGILGVPAEAHWQGRSLQPLFLNNQSRSERTLISELPRLPQHPKDQKRSAIFDSWQLIHTWSGEGQENKELFNLATDPLAQSDLSTQESKRMEDLSAKMRKAVDSAIKKFSEGTTIDVDQEALEHLKTLGYVE